MADATFLETGGNTEISQYGFTWTVQGVGHTYGLFANGDAWIVRSPSITITDIQPASTTSGNIKNGTQVNPSFANRANQGYDDQMQYMGWDAALNVSPNYTGSDLVISADSSVMSSKSLDSPGQHTRLEAMAVLTVLSSAPAANSFRPPYVGADKAIIGAVVDLDYSFLSTYAPPASTPSLPAVEANFERVWVEQNTTWAARPTHPTLNQPDYGQQIANELGDGLLMLNLNYSNAVKETLMIRLVQYGIDVYGAAREGFVWAADGGHNQGRKGPLLLAGRALNNADILSYGDKALYFGFQEDQQHFYVSQTDVDTPRYTGDGRQRDPYTVPMIGTPEWGEKHASAPERDGSNWNVLYRSTNGPQTLQHATAVRMMSLDGKWNWTPFFDYTDRWYSIETPTGFAAEMYLLEQAASNPISLTTPTSTNIDQTTATVGCSTDRATGTLYAYVSTSAAAPSITDLKAGTGAAWSGNQLNPVSPQTFSAIGLTENTTYYSHFYQEDGADTSNVLSSSPWSTLSSGNGGGPLDYVELTISAASVPSDLTGFVVYVDLADMPPEFWSVVTVGGGDIRCFENDGTTGLAREVVSCLPGPDTGELYFKVPGVLSSTVDPIFRLYVDGTSTEPPFTDPLGRNAVWSEYNGVYHFQGDGTDSSGTGPTLAIGPGMGPGSTFNADSVTIEGNNASYSGLTGSNFSGASYTGYHLKLRWDLTSGQTFGFRFFQTKDKAAVTNGELRWQENVSSHTNSGGSTTQRSIDTGTVRGVGIVTSDYTYAGVDLTSYLNGAVVATDSNFTAPAIADDHDIEVGGANDGAAVNGTLYECRISKVSHSGDWVATENNNLNTTSFYTAVAVGGPVQIILSAPTQADITENTATVGCSTDRLTGTLYAYVSESATAPTVDDLKAGTGATWSDNQLNPTSPQTFSVTGLKDDTIYYTYFYQEDGADVSNVLESGSWRTAATSIVLSDPTQTDINKTTATLGCTTSDLAGTMWVYVSTSATSPTEDDMRNGTGAVYWEPKAPTGNPVTFSAVGLTAGTTYYTYFYQEDGNSTSNILASTSWSTMPEATPILSNPTETNIGQGTATIGCTTDTLSGILYAYTSTSAIAPSIPDLKAGTGAIFADNKVPTTAVNNFSATGLEPDETYYNYFYQENGEVSAILESGPWNTLEGLIPSNIAGIDVLECLFRTAANSNLTMVGLVQIPDSGAVGVEVNNIRATLTWDGSRYVGPAADIANYLASNPDQSIPIRFFYGEDFQGGFAAGFSEGFQ